MRIVVITPEYPPLVSGGIGVSVATLARALTDAGHQVWVVVPDAIGSVEDDEVEGDAVRVVGVPVDAPPRLGWLVVRRALGRAVRALVDREHVDVVATVDWLGLGAGLRPGAPLVVHCHGSATYFADLLGGRLRAVDRWCERAALRQADAVTAVSDFTAERTQTLFGLVTRPTVVVNGIDLTEFDGVSPPRADRLVLHVGTLVRKKGAFDLGPAFSEVVRRHPDARLRIVGRDVPDRASGGPSSWALAEAGFSADAAARVEHLGPVTHDQLPALLDECALCLFPSYAEACPLTWLESMAAGRAIVGYDLPWARELVEPGRTGWLAPVGHAVAAGRLVAEALDDADRLARIGGAARMRARERFGLDTLVRDTLEVYQGVRQA